MGNEHFTRGNVGVFHSQMGRNTKFWMTLRVKGKKGYKVSGNRNLPLERFWSKSRVMRVQTAASPPLMRRGSFATRNASREELQERYRKEEKSSEWTLKRIREPYEKVTEDEIGRLGIVQDILRKSTDFGRIIAPVGGKGGVTLSYICPHCNSVNLEDYIWWVSTGHGDGNNRRKKHCSWWCAVGEANTNGERQTGYWLCSSVPMPLKQRCSKRAKLGQRLGDSLLQATETPQNFQCEWTLPQLRV